MIIYFVLFYFFMTNIKKIIELPFKNNEERIIFFLRFGLFVFFKFFGVISIHLSY